MKIGFISLGCAKNLVDSEYIVGLFADPFFEYESNPNKCDAILINTCGFILSAKEEAIDTILEMAELKKKKLKKLIVTGCLVQRYCADLIAEMPEVDLFIPISDYPRMHELLSELFHHPFAQCFGENRQLIGNTHTAYLKISDGCDNRCSYCAIPLIRGNCHSYPLEENIKEARRLYELGVSELNVVAQDTTYYGHDLYGAFKLKELLEQLDNIPFEWIRILYMYPDEIEDGLLLAMSKAKRILPYFDIPIQYGNDYLLKRMNRRGSVQLIRKTVSRIRELFEEPIIRTTIIVGFPGETEEMFLETLNLVKELEFDSLGAFTYSPEEDTVSYSYPEQIDEELKQDRYERLMEVQRQIVFKNNEKKIGRCYKVLIERYEELFNRYVGRTYMSAPDGVDGVVYIRTDNDLKIGEYVKVKIVDFKEYDLIGVIEE